MYNIFTDQQLTFSITPLLVANEATTRGDGDRCLREHLGGNMPLSENLVEAKFAQVPAGARAVNEDPTQLGIAQVHDQASSTPLVAVVTPVYNGARFLAEVLDTVQAQTYRNVVHIVQDNASTDETPEIIARYANARVPVLAARNDRTLSLQENWNVAASRIPKQARYFRFLCADDLMAPTFISRLTELMEQNPSAIVAGCNITTVEASSTDDCWDSYWDKDRNIFSGKEAIARHFLGRGQIMVIHALIRRDALDLRQPFIDCSLLLSDIDMCLDLLRHGDWGFVHEALAKHREHTNSVTSTVARPTRLDAADLLTLLQRYAPFAMGEKEGLALTRQYQRYYQRQLLLWRVRAPETFKRHVEALKATGSPHFSTHFADFSRAADSVADWVLIRLRLRSAWPGARGF